MLRRGGSGGGAFGYGSRFPNRKRSTGTGPSWRHSPLAVPVSEIKGERDRVGVDENVRHAANARGLFRKSEQNAAVALPLNIATDADETKACLVLPDDVDAHCI